MDAEADLSTPREDLPSTPRKEYEAAAPDVKLGRDLMAGTRRMQDEARASGYVPVYPSEKLDTDRYTRRVKAAKVYGGLSRTVSASVGMMFAKAPELDERLRDGGALADWWDNVDLAGADGTVFAKRFAEDAVADGFAAIVTDFPTVPNGVQRTAANEAAFNLRPYFRRYRRADILSWRMGVAQNRIVPVQIVLRESRDADAGAFGSQSSLQYRVLRLSTVTDTATGVASTVASWEVLIETTSAMGSTGVTRIAGGFFTRRDGALFREIPFALGYGGRVDAPFVAAPPLLDVAWANLYYWRKEITYNHHNELCGFPILHTEGLAGAKDSKGNEIPYQFGPDSHAQTAGGGTVEWVEMAGTSSALHVVAMDREKRDMAELGMSFLAGDKRAQETAEAKRLDATAENATLSTAATGIEDALNLSLMFAAQYMGLDNAQAPALAINRDFESTVMDAQTMVAYVTAVENAGLPGRALVEAWVRGGRLPEDTDVDALLSEMEANMAAEADRAAMDAEAKASALAGWVP